MVSSRSTRAVRRAGLAIVASILLLATPGVAHAAPPTNDAFANAIAVTEPLPFTDTQDTSEATSEEGEPAVNDLGCGFIAATVWYSFVPSVDTIVAADTIGSDFDTILAVWEGTDLDALSLVGCADDTRGGLQSTVPFLAEAGAEYRIQVGGFVGQGGALSFRVKQTTAGFIEGTVTREDTAAPLEGICVIVVDAVFSSNSNFGLTRVDGTFRIAVRPGEYVVAFFDCERDAYVNEFWDDAATDADATEVVVVADAVVSGIDAALAPGCPGFGGSGLNQIVGTSGADTLLGTTAPDVICGFRGDDTLRGGIARDVLLGGAGDDALRGSDGNDTLIGSIGRDSLFGGDGRDELYGGRDRDLCDGGLGRDFAGSCEVERRIELP